MKKVIKVTLMVIEGIFALIGFITVVCNALQYFGVDQIKFLRDLDYNDEDEDYDDFFEEDDTIWPDGDDESLDT